jgi:4-hydroxythreonine-4-phosphate dehydrogenase
MKEDRLKIGITQGDMNSISYEVILKTLADPRVYENCTPIVYGSPKVMAYHRKALNLNNVNLNTVRSAEEANARKPYIINCLDDQIRVELGKSTSMAGEASVKTLQMAVQDIKDRKIDVLVTAPINKQNIQSDNFRYPGHTEYLKAEFKASEVLMIMVNQFMRVGVVTGHVPINQVASLITADSILTKLRILNRSLTMDFGIRRPRIAVLGLNPHAGDDGVIGNEENEVIIPAIKIAKEENIMALGPYPADGFFGAGSFKKFDGILAMYHDQGLIPFKALTIDGGVNYTAGLPIVRTSPAHGTAYELVGKDEASPDSFREALYLAIDIYKNRVLHDELSSNPLKETEIKD